MVWFAVADGVRQGKIAAGDTVLVLAGAPDRQSTAAADVLRIVQVAVSESGRTRPGMRTRH